MSSPGHRTHPGSALVAERRRLIGIDPGLRNTGWGVVDVVGGRLSYVADGTVRSDGDGTLAERLLQLHNGLMAVLEAWRPDEAAVEETFVNKNAATTLKLGQARAVALLVPARCGLPVAEYPTNLVKKSVVGAGHADKLQVQVMVKQLLPGAQPSSPDSADALAVAICHAHHAAINRRWGLETRFDRWSRIPAKPGSAVGQPPRLPAGISIALPPDLLGDDEADAPADGVRPEDKSS
ncbi:MAG TPA: crossover junction endodeoxyribonuclease RuvC [Azospirillaceae bacterium]|nr:crossover junction endodeoxyribonuclease RuvC [Azospirillaceae bacterium]